MNNTVRRSIWEQADDAAVIERSQREPDRFAAVFDRHAAHIHRYLARQVGSEAADDLVAETFLVAFRKRGRYDGSHRDARPWLYGIATNLVSQHRRKELRGWRRAQDPVAGPFDQSERVLGDLTARSIRPLLTDALAELADRDRDVVLLIACEDLTYEEVARALCIPVGTVRSRLHRARAELRQRLMTTEAATTYEEILTNE